MQEVFEYADTTKEANYATYFALAGLKLDSTETDAPGAYLFVAHVGSHQHAGGDSESLVESGAVAATASASGARPEFSH